MTEHEKKMIDRFIKDCQKDHPENPHKVFACTKVKIGYNFFGNSSLIADENREKVDTVLRYVADQLGLE